MSGEKEKIDGEANESIGKIKQGVGTATDNRHLHREGEAQEVKGHGQKAVGAVKDAAADAEKAVADRR